MARGEAMHRQGSEGFTLIELMIVITVVLIMYVMAYGPAQQSYQEKQLVACQRNLQLIHVAMKIYAADYHESYPVATGAATAETPLSLLVPRCTTETAIFICPGSANRRLPEAQPFTGRKISYAYYMGHTARDAADELLISDKQIDARVRRTGEQMFSPDGRRPGNNHRQFGGNMLFCDGHAETFASVASRDFAFSNSVVLLNPKP
jgi:prepilin-type N-terminal cleavage/methylation domain-containing protein/prepilin-type processing-associated H-X9-DG protein